MDKLGYMDDLEVDLELGIFVFEGVKAVRGRDNDLLHPAVDECLDVLSGKAFE